MFCAPSPVPRPPCRQPIDRHDLSAMGYDVSPGHLSWVAGACGDLRTLRQGTHGGRSPPTADAIRRCARLNASDGFVYNTCLMAIERMLFHKGRLAESLREQLSVPENSGCDPCDFVRMSLDCHVDVLLHDPGVGA